MQYSHRVRKGRLGLVLAVAMAATALITIAPGPDLPASAQTGGATSQTFSYTGSAQSFTVPANVTSLSVTATGPGGGAGSAAAGNSGGTGGAGGGIAATLTVTPGEVLQINIGNHGDNATSTHGGNGGFHGGGADGNVGDPTSGQAGGGGGSTDIRRGGTATANRVVVAAGGGGGGGAGIAGAGGHGGAGGGPGAGSIGSAGTTAGAGGLPGAPGDLSSGGIGGTGPGSPGDKGALGFGGVGGQGGGSGSGGGAGGGGGYFGGGGGAGAIGGGGGGGAGGGSSFGPSGSTGIPGAAGGSATSVAGDGSVIISWTVDSTTTTSSTSTSTSTSTTSTTLAPVDRFAITSYDRMAPGAPHNGYFISAFQVFTARSNRITYLGVTVGTPGYVPDGHTVHVRLCADSNCSQVLADANAPIVNYGNSFVDIGDVGVNPGQQYYVVYDQPFPWHGQPWVTYWWEGGNFITTSDQMQAVVKGYNSSTPPTTPPPPPPTVAPRDCEAFVADITILDDTRINHGATFTKVWRLRNCGNTNWSGLTAVRIGGSFGPLSFGVPITAPGATADISVQMTAPNTTGTSRSTYTFFGPRGRVLDSTGGLGQFFVQIIVVSSGGVVPPVGPPPSGGATYVALGDSYSAGEGNYPYIFPTDSASPYNQCHRSNNAYGPRLSRDIGTLSGLKFTACSGAITDDLFVANPKNTGEPAQLNSQDLGSATKTITLTIGGNDIGFASVLADCIYGRGPVSAYNYNAPGCANNRNITSLVALRTAALAGANHANAPGGRTIHSIGSIIERIHQLAPNATIYVADYPRLLGSQTPPGQTNCIVGVAHIHNTGFGLLGTVDDNLFLAESDISWLIRAGAALDNTIMSQVSIERSKGLPVVPVDVRTAFAGHGICDVLTPVIKSVVADVDGSQPTHPRTTDSGSFHPDATGQSIYEGAFRSAGVH